MTNVGAELSSELTRIIECPYPASLANLACLLSRTDDHTVRACIQNRPSCAVARLATLVFEALPLWAYTLRVLQSLCHSVEFRDKLLLQNHGLLNALLVKANSSQRDFDDYLELCVLILSRPLPKSISLPASAQSFFLRIFERATINPDVSTLKPVYYILNGACRQLLSHLPTETRQQFDRELCHILSSNGTGQNSMLLLWCFGIVLLAEHPDDIEIIQSSRPSADQPVSTPNLEQQWKTTSGRKLFGSTSGLYKTINLTYLSVIWATKGDVGVTDIEAIEGIRIAVRTLRFVTRDVREGWPKSSALARSTFPKLPSKILRSGICPAIQLEALCFYAMIAGPSQLLPEVVAQYEDCLEKMATFADADSLGETLLLSLPIFAMQDNSVRALLSEILDSCISIPTPHQSSSIVTLVDGLTMAMATCAPLRSKMVLAISSSSLREKLLNFIQAPSVNESVTCRTYAASLHREVVSATISSLLTLILTTGTAESSFLHSLVAALIKKQREFPHVANQCSHSSATTSSISLFQQECTPYTGQHLQDWRDRLRSELESQNFYQRDSVIRSVAQICQDLETRCNTVEEPLQREQQRSKELDQQVSRLNEQVSSLKAQADDDRYHLEGLEDEKLTMAEERDSASTKLNELKAHFAEVNRMAGETLRAVHDDFHAKELELRSTILAREESIRTGASEIEELNSAVDRLRQALKEKEEEQKGLNEQYQDLRRRLHESESQLGSERETNDRQSQEITRLKDQNVDIENQLQSTETELEILTGRLSDLQVNHQELVQSSEEALRELEIRHTNDMDSAAAKADGKFARLNSELQDALRDGCLSKEAYEEVRRDLQLLQNSIPPLEAKIQQLTGFCSEQEEELDELRTLRRNVLKSFGLATPYPLATRASTRSQAESNDPQTPHAPREHRRRKSALQTQDTVSKATGSAQALASTAMEGVANASFVSSDSHDSQNGSTPKRSKPHPSSKVPAMQTPYTQRPILNFKSLSKKLSPSKRSALKQTSPNRRHTTVGFAVSEDEDEQQYGESRSAKKRCGSLQDAEQPDFDMDDFLVGTPLMTPGRFDTGTGRVPDEDDMTTTEL